MGVTDEKDIQRDSTSQRGEYLSNLIADKCRRGNDEDAFDPKEVAELVQEYGLKPLVHFLHKRRNHETKNNECEVQQPLLSRRLFGALYTAVTKCTQKEAGAKRLHQALLEFSQTFFRDGLLPTVQGLDGEIFLQRFTEIWQDFLLFEAWTSKLFRHFNSENTVDLQSTTAELLALFKSDVFYPMSSQLRKALLSIIHSRRSGLVVDKNLIREIVSVFIAMDVDQCMHLKNLTSTVSMISNSSCVPLNTYIKEFETSFINLSKDYYLDQAQCLFEDQDMREYLNTVEKFFANEKDLARTCLHPRTETKLSEVLVDALLRPRCASIIEDRQVGLSILLDEGSRPDLHRMLSLFSSFTEGNKCLCKEFSKHLETKIRNLRARSCERPSGEVGDLQLIDSIVQLYRHYKSIIDDMLSHSSEYLDILRKTVSTLFASSSEAEQYSRTMARYLHSLIKSGDIAEDDWRLNVILELLRLLNHQDFFLHEFENMLAERLLQYGISRADLERSIISKLKLEMGSLATRRMEGMYRDITEGSTSVTNAFYELVPRAVNHFEPTVLSTSHWPFTGQANDVSPPSQFCEMAEVFVNFYAVHWDHMRRLRWLWSKGRAQLYGFFDGETPKLLHTSILQAFVLLLFNDFESWSLEEISKTINLSKNMTAQIIHSLSARAQKRVSGKGGVITRVGTKYVVNTEYKNPRKTLKLPVPILRDQQPTKHEDKVKENRRFEIDAVIVRLMKARQKMSHQELLAEVRHQIRRFPAEPKVIKHRIEDLINRDYLARDEEDSQCYVYVS